MPVDAILMGSRVMATKESMTGEQSKQLILNAPGVHNEMSRRSDI